MGSRDGDQAESPNAGPDLLRLTGISKAFFGVRALKGVSFDLRAGECHALVGENGAGKSTLIKVVTGAHRPDEGTIEVRGRRVAENIALGLERPGGWRRVRWGERRRRARALLDRIGAAIDPETEVRRLAMAEQQLVEIARALGADARVLIMDEPTASLSDTEVEHLFGVIRELKGQGVGIVYISHRLEELPQVADRVTALRDGGLVGTRPMADVTRADLIKMMVGRELSSVFPKIAVTPGAPVLELRRLGCRASGVRDVSLTVRAGEIVGLAGLLGAGRTELARVLFGLTPADEGAILIDGEIVTIPSPSRATALGVAYVPEDRRRHGVVLEMSVAANATLAVLGEVSRLGLIDGGRERSLAAGFVERLSVKTSSLDAPVASLSGGNQQKVALARWLATGPRVLILDEPTQGVDVGAKAEIHRLMGELAGRGMAILMISSELPEVLGMSDRVAVMHAGTVVDVVDRGRASQELLLELALGHRPSAVMGVGPGGGTP